jgi:hypothetical protein
MPHHCFECRHRLTYGDIKLRVAERMVMVRESSGVVAVPTDAGELDRISRAVADAQRMVLSATNPLTGQSVSWKWLERPVSVTLGVDGVGLSPPDVIGTGGDPHRWLIDQPVMDVPQGPVSYTMGTTATGGCGIPIRTFRHVYELGVSDPDGRLATAVGFEPRPSPGDMRDGGLSTPGRPRITFGRGCSPPRSRTTTRSATGRTGRRRWCERRRCWPTRPRTGSPASARADSMAAKALVDAIGMNRHSGSDVIPAPDEMVNMSGTRLAA